MTEDLRNRVETILNSALEEIDISDIMSSDSRTELIVDALEEKIEEIDLITEDISAAYITPELSVSSSGVKATYDAERNALKLSGTATGTRRILCLNGQNSIATTYTDFNQTFADGRYHFEMSILSEGQTPSKSISWSYTYGKFSNGAPIFTNGNTSATLTFTDHPVMVGLYFANGTEFGQGGESDSDYTYITFTATRLSAIDLVARDDANNAISDAQDAADLANGASDLANNAKEIAEEALEHADACVDASFNGIEYVDWIYNTPVGEGTDFSKSYIDKEGNKISSDSYLTSPLITSTVTDGYNMVMLTPPRGKGAWITIYENDAISSANFVAQYGDYENRRTDAIICEIKPNQSFVVSLGVFSNPSGLASYGSNEDVEIARQITCKLLKTASDGYTEEIGGYSGFTSTISGTYVQLNYSYDDELDALKLYGTAPDDVYILCLNGQNSRVSTSTAFNKTFDAGTYTFEVNVSGYSGTRPIRWAYTYGTFSSGVTMLEGNEGKVTVTFDRDAMVGLALAKYSNFGTESEPTSISISISKVTAVDSVARAYVEESRDICAEYAEDAAESAAVAQAVKDSMPADYSELSGNVDEVTEDVDFVTITPTLNDEYYGLTFAYDESRNAIKVYGTSNAARRVLCLNGQNAGAITSTPFSKTMEDGTYTCEMTVSGHTPDKPIIWQYTYETFSTSAACVSTGVPKATVTFTNPVMLGLSFSNATNFGVEDDPTYITFTATRLSAIDLVARDGVANLYAAEARVSPVTMACFGDSIMWGRDGNGTGQVDEAYRIPSILAHNLKISTTNYGVSSQGYIGIASETAYQNIASKDLTAFNTLLMCYGVNDGYKVLGDWDSTDESTIMGQFNKIINHIYTQNPTMRVIVVAPYNGTNVGSYPDYWYGERDNPPYVSRRVLSDTLKKACDYYWIPYIEQYDGPLAPKTITVMLPDGVHPSVDAYKRIGEWLSAKVGALL